MNYFKSAVGFFSFFSSTNVETKNVCPIAYNTIIYATKNKTMKATNLGIWYQQIPSMIIVNPLGEVIEPKTHNGSKFVLINRVRFPVSKLTKLNREAAMNFKGVFCS